jgi:hypothetical protein
MFYTVYVHWMYSIYFIFLCINILLRMVIYYWNMWKSEWFVILYKLHAFVIVYG